jgi:hypothetical protein
MTYTKIPPSPINATKNHLQTQGYKPEVLEAVCYMATAFVIRAVEVGQV